MKEVYRRCCGMDVHKDTVVVCVLPPVGGEGKAIRKTYGTFRNDLIRMRVWLKQLKVSEIAMESTGVYWRPLWNVLEEEGFRLLLVNPAQVKALAGRKSDGRDAQRIAEFLQDRRLDASFVPPAEIRQLRMMLRHRIALLEQRNEVHNQIRDLFETAGLKLSSVVSDLLGVSGRRILEALIAGEQSPEILCWKVRGRLRAKEKLVKESLKGYFTEFHRSMLESHYKHYRFLTSEIGIFEERIARAQPFPTPIIVPVGRVLCRARTRAQESRKALAAEKATAHCGVFSLRPHGRRPTARQDTCRRSSVASNRDEGGPRPSSLLPTKFSPSLSTCFAPVRPITTWDRTTSTASIPLAPPKSSSLGLRPSDTTCSYHLWRGQMPKSVSISSCLRSVFQGNCPSACGEVPLARSVPSFSAVFNPEASAAQSPPGRL